MSGGAIIRNSRPRCFVTVVLFFYTKENKPKYLKEVYGINTNDKGGLNLKKLVWEDFKFVDSKKETGVQIIDLVASGLRRCLRGGFSNNKNIARELGGLMVDLGNDRFPINFITLSNMEIIRDDAVAISVSKICKKAQRQMLL